MRNKKLNPLFAMIVFFAAFDVHAQVIPGSAEGSRFEKNKEDQQKLEIRPVEELIETKNKEYFPKTEGVFFKLKKLDITGSTVYSDEELKKYYARYTDQKIPLSALYEIAGAITQRYRDDGYILSKAIIPPQEIEKGQAKIQIIEGYIKKVTFETHEKLGRIPKAIAAAIELQRPLNIKYLERNMLILNDLPGLKARGVVTQISEDNTETGAVGFNISLEKQDFINNVTFDNSGSRYVGPYQVGLRLGRNNNLIDYDQVVLETFISPQVDELRYGNIGYSVPINKYGTTIESNISNTLSEPGYTLKQNEIESNTISMNIGVKHPIIRSRQENLFVGLKFNYKNIDSDILGSELYRDKIRALRLNLSYDNIDSLKGSNQISSTFSQGLDIMGARETGSLNLSRSQGESDFQKVELSASRLQYINKDFNLFTAVTSQYADSPLLSSEEFGYGGQAFGRAYDASEITGDKGVAATVELRYTDISLVEQIAMQPFVFYDVGKVWNLDTGGDDLSGSSAGAGFRYDAFKKFGGNINISQPLTRPIAAPDYGNGKNPRINFSVNYDF